MDKKITLIWRDENYGSISGAKAFRAAVDPYPSDSARARLARIYRKHGFEVNHTRAAWIAQYKPDDAPARLVEALRDAGYDVTSEGCVPDALLDNSAPAP